MFKNLQTRQKGVLLRIVFKIALIGCDKIPTTYRKNIVALLKEALKNSGNPALATINSDAKQKPFTFSLRFDILESKGGHIVLAGDVFELYFSTYDYAILTAVYNYLLRSLDGYAIFGGNSKNRLINASLLPSKEIRGEKALLKTLSPILVRDMANKEGDRTLRWDEAGFVENLRLSIKSTIKAFLDEEIDPETVGIKIAQMKSDNIMSYGNGKKSYGIYGNTGILEITAKSEHLQLLYDVGIGGKRSQGFGMMEVVGG